MKMKTTLVLAVLCWALIGCDGGGSGHKQFSSTPQEETPDASPGSWRIARFNGHQYVIYTQLHGVGSSSSGGASVVHDPDCPCGKKVDEVEK